MFEYIIEILSSLWSNEQNESVEEGNLEPIDQGWIALLSEFEQKISQEKRDKITEELRFISSNKHNRQIFPRIYETVRHIFSQYDSTVFQELSLVPLTSDIKYCIFKDIFTKLSPKWLDYIVQIVPEIRDDWYPEKYQQNILGKIISISSSTSPDQLTLVGLSQTIKIFHYSLVQLLNSYCVNPISPEESCKLLDFMMSSTISKIIDLWIDTVQKCKNGLSKAGQTVAKINKEEQDHMQRLREIKESGQFDAQYSTGENDPIRQKYLEGKQGTLIARRSFCEIQKQLDEKLRL